MNPGTNGFVPNHTLLFVATSCLIEIEVYEADNKKGASKDVVDVEIGAAFVARSGKNDDNIR